MKRKRGLAVCTAALLLINLLLPGGWSMPEHALARGSQRHVQELNLAMPGEPSTGDVSKATDGLSMSVLNNVMEGLVRLGPDGMSITPGVAKRWEVSADGLTYTFHLRDNARWSNGDLVTAQDFEYSWKRTLDPKTASQYAFMVAWIKGGTDYNAGKGTADQVAVKALDDWTLQVQLESPRPYFIKQMAFSIFFPQHQEFIEEQGMKYGGDADKMLFNGPFRIREWKHDASLTLVRNEMYWDDQHVQLDRVNINIITDSNTALNLYQAGEVDVVGLSRDQIKPFRNSPELHKDRSPATWYLEYNSRIPALRNPKVRQALTYAIDAQAYVDVTLDNGAVPATGLTPWDVSDGQGGQYRQSLGDVLKRQEHAPQAKALLAEGLREMGLSKFPQVTLITGETNTGRIAGQFLQEQWRQKLGIQVEVQSLPLKLKIQRTQASDFDIVIGGWWPDYDDAMSFLEMWTTDSDFNHVHWSNPQYDKLIEAAKREGDPKRHVALMQQAEQILISEMPFGPLQFDASMRLIKSYAKGIVIPKIGAGWDLKYAYIEGKK